MHQLPHLYPWVKHQPGVPPVTELGRSVALHVAALIPNETRTRVQHFAVGNHVF
jgi:hypothetical protein